MKQKKVISLVINLLNIGLCYSQVDTLESNSTQIYFGNSKDKSKSTYNGQAIKVGVFDILSGMYGIHYERELSSLFSVQIGGGLTGRNLMQSLNESATGVYQEESDYYVSPKMDEPDYIYDLDTRKSKLGWFFAFHPKIFYQFEGFEGGYIGFFYQYRNYKFSAYNVDPESSSEMIYTSSSTMDEYENQSIMGISYGIQTLGDRVVVDYNLGVGMRKITGMRRDTGYESNPSLPYLQPGAILNELNKSEFYLEILFKIGLWSSK